MNNQVCGLTGLKVGCNELLSMRVWLEVKNISLIKQANSRALSSMMNNQVCGLTGLKVDRRRFVRNMGL